MAWRATNSTAKLRCRHHGDASGAMVPWIAGIEPASKLLGLWMQQHCTMAGRQAGHLHKQTGVILNVQVLQRTVRVSGFAAGSGSKGKPVEVIEEVVPQRMYTCQVALFPATEVRFRAAVRMRRRPCMRADS